MTKTVYAAILGLAIGIIAVPYPFYPRHLTIVSSLTIGIPGFFLALAPGAPRAQGGFLQKVLRFTAPAGAIAALATLASYLVAGHVWGASVAQARTAATGTLLVLGLVVLALVPRPLVPLRVLLVVAMAGVAVLVWTVPASRHLFSLVAPPVAADISALLVVAIAAPSLVLAVLLSDRQRRRHSDHTRRPTTSA